MDEFTGSSFVLSKNFTNIIRSKFQLDQWIEEVKRADSNKKTELLRSTFYLRDFQDFWSVEPDSQDYFHNVMALYEEISGRKYSVDLEAVVSGGRNVEIPFPFVTMRKEPVADNLLGVASILRMLPVQPPASILDLGCGWANTSLTLARTGYNVTCSDVDESCSEIVDHWKTKLGIEKNIKFVPSDLSSIAESLNGEKFDAIIFFKSFHHCVDPTKLLNDCAHLLRPDGCLVLAAEPITPNFYVPWGIRCDGTSVFAIAQHGWMELGFDLTYFTEIAKQAGLSLLSRHVSKDIPTMNGLVFQKC